MIGLSWDEVNALVLKARETERQYIIRYLEAEIIVGKEWCKTSKQKCNEKDRINNAATIRAYENILNVLKENPLTRGTE